MKVCVYSENDWANLGYLYAKSLSSVGVEARAYTQYRHVFDYTEQASTDMHECAEFMSDSDVLLMMHSYKRTPNHYRGGKIFVHHGGTVYRLYHEQLNKYFNQFVNGTIVQDGCFLDKGAKNAHWVMAPVDTDTLRPVPGNHEDEIWVGHFPSCKPEDKGSFIIERVFRELREMNLNNKKVRYIFRSDPIPWKDHIKQVSQCDIYIEQLMPEIPMYGDPGISALEAASLGCIVLSNFVSYWKYFRVFGTEPGIIPVTMETLKNTLISIILGPELKRSSIKTYTREWVQNFHSYQAVGKQLVKAFESQG